MDRVKALAGVRDVLHGVREPGIDPADGDGPVRLCTLTHMCIYIMYIYTIRIDSTDVNKSKITLPRQRPNISPHHKIIHLAMSDSILHYDVIKDYNDDNKWIPVKFMRAGWMQDPTASINRQ